MTHAPDERPPDRPDVIALTAVRSEEVLRGESPVMRLLKGLLARIGASPASTVLITGESGTGKDGAAKIIHSLSARRQFPFVNITCSALPEALLESELFGHERGAFTDARQRRKGLLEEAAGGTVFLDEIGEMTPSLQAKMLRFLEERAFRRVGGAGDVHADVRVIAATHRDLRQRVASGEFRQDLYYRLAVVHLQMPPLRERTGDVALLVEHFLATFAESYQKPIPRLSKAARDKLMSHPWPGNVRELKNAIERAVLLADTEEIRAEELDMSEVEDPVDAFRLPPSGINLEELERALVLQALEKTTGNKSRAGSLLGLTRDQIRHRIEKFNIDCSAYPRGGPVPDDEG